MTTNDAAGIDRPMTLAELAAIETRAVAATPGPWAVDCWRDDEGFREGWEIDGPAGFDRPQFEHEGDARFLAAARDDIPRMAAEIHRLWDMVDRMVGVVRDDDWTEPDDD